MGVEDPAQPCRGVCLECCPQLTRPGVGRCEPWDPVSVACSSRGLTGTHVACRVEVCYILSSGHIRSGCSAHLDGTQVPIAPGAARAGWAAGTVQAISQGPSLLITGHRR